MATHILPAGDVAKSLVWASPVPFFTAKTIYNPNYEFSSLGGRYVALLFFGSKSINGDDFFNVLRQFKQRFTAGDPVVFGVTSDEADLSNPEILSAFPYNRLFYDPGFEIAAKYGLIMQEDGGAKRFCPYWYIIDPMMRVYAAEKLSRFDLFKLHIEKLPTFKQLEQETATAWAPVLLLPRVFPKAFCAELISLYKNGNPQESGFMRQRGSQTVGVLDPSFKRRKDFQIEDAAVKSRIKAMLFHRLIPEIKKSFQFEATRIERYIIAGYTEQDSGFFKAHRDNTTVGTAHRRFAVTINLNAEEYEGGDLRFPEFGSRIYRAPTGGAVVFSCSLLHEALPVTQGERYATLPFLYGDKDAEVKTENSKHIVSKAQE